MSVHHYVVSYDTETRTWDYAGNIEIDKFQERTVFPTGDTTLLVNPSLFDTLKSIDEQVGERLHLGIRFLNWNEAQNKQVS